MDLNTPLNKVPGIGYTYAKRLIRLNLFSVSDLINHYPFRYDDFSTVSSALEAQIGQKVTLQGEIWSIKNIYTRSRKVLTQAVFNDGTSPIILTWFNSPWLTKQIEAGDHLQVSGKMTKYKNKLSIMAPAWEKLETSQVASPRLARSTIHTGRLVPIYPETYGVSSKWLRTKIVTLLPLLKEIQDPLPKEIRANMLLLSEALHQIHLPENYQLLEKARERLAFDELFYIQLATLKIRTDWKKKPSVKPFKISLKKLSDFIKNLPFKLTKAQIKVIKEITADLQLNQPMNRLIQGEVGSGKTVVATIISFLTYLNGYKTLFMAPTEILAFQHFETISKLLEPYGISVGIYTGSRKQLNVIVRNEMTKQSNKRIRLPRPSGARNDEILSDIIVGTHALLSDKLPTENVGLVIIDEQQRFGVEQRSFLRSRAKVPHFLTMTATPIPRTVALTLYGDLDLSIINELPKGRPKISTHLVPESKRTDSYQFIKNHIKDGEQTYIITPLIEQSETLISAKAAKVEFDKLKKDIFPDLRLGLLHGRLKSKEKEQVINNFKNHQTDILVSTSVVEVGMDIPNATIMVIEGAERFGLAQLHQLRGRIGRGTKTSYCLLYTSDVSSAQERSRLKHLESTFDGLKLAELDLKIRGSGEIFGTRQSGRFELKIASFSDLGLIEKTREAARQILGKDPTLDKYPLLQAQLQRLADIMPD